MLNQVIVIISHTKHCDHKYLPIWVSGKGFTQNLLWRNPSAGQSE